MVRQVADGIAFGFVCIIDQILPARPQLYHGVEYFDLILLYIIHFTLYWQTSIIPYTIYQTSIIPSSSYFDLILGPAATALCLIYFILSLTQYKSCLKSDTTQTTCNLWLSCCRVMNGGREKVHFANILAENGSGLLCISVSLLDCGSFNAKKSQIHA